MPRRYTRQPPLQTRVADELVACLEVPVPKNRTVCRGGARPCMAVRCRYHLALDWLPDGDLRINFPDRMLAELRETCGLDVADRRPHDCEEIGPLMGTVGERIRQIAVEAMGKFPCWLGDLEQGRRVCVVDTNEISR